MADTLIIFIKNPQPGRVKTRLARTVGAAEALRIYHLLLEKTRAAVLGHPAERYLFYSDFVEENDGWVTPDFQKKTQRGADLGERMAAAFAEVFATGAGKAVIIGSDCPDLSPDILHLAFAALDHHDFVLGPTPDGGYYLLGMKTFVPQVFQNIAWSTEAVRGHTLEKIMALGLTCFLLPELADVDTEADWKRVMERN